jgi:hypothetical protein
VYDWLSGILPSANRHGNAHSTCVGELDLRKQNSHSSRLLLAILAVLLLGMIPGDALRAKEKPQYIDANDVTARLYQLLDDTHSGKLTEFLVLADIYKDKDSKDTSQEFQHILLLDYDKSKNFGRLNMHVRSVGKLDADQLKTYSLKQIYDFGIDDLEKFVKTDPGQFGRQGDLYLRANSDMPISTAPITEETRKAYEFYLLQYVLPALQKK